MDAQAALRTYRYLLRGKHKLNTYEDALKFAQRAGEKLAIVLNPDEIVGMGEAELLAYAEPLFREMHSQTSRAAQIVQRKINRDAGIGLNPLVAEYDPAQVRAIVQQVIDGNSIAELTKDIVNTARKEVDETARRNMEAQDRSGLEVKIIRRYDDVGVHNGKDICQWCMDRAGEFDSYQAAFDAGVFERHPGCGCTVEYHVGKTHSFRDASGNWRDI
jgi:hypothetical protein